MYERYGHIRRLLRRAVVLLAVTATVAVAAEQNPTPAPGLTPWEERFYDPKPAPGDMVLPMPCGGAMVFRKIETPTGTNPLDDRRLTLGDPEAATDFSEFVREDFLRGGFVEQGRSFYYLGKYKVTADQARALTEPGCSPPSMAGRRPAVKLSWFDAVQLAERYDEWLYKHAVGKLPKIDQATGFIRLPTEPEWEYAARGGVSVSEVDFRARLFPMSKDVTHYAWFQGSRSAAGLLRPVGLLAPNPLGLYDIIGDADEIVLEPFRLNKVGRLLGEAGGFIIKGGDYETAEERLRSSMRIELPHFDALTGKPTRLRMVGVRFAIGAVAITSLADTTKLRTAFQELSTRGNALSDDPQKLLGGMIKNATDGNLKRGLEGVLVSLQEQTRARKEFEGRAVRSSISSGAVLAWTVQDLDKRARAIREYLNDAETDRQHHVVGADQRVAEFSRAVGGIEGFLHNNLAAYSQLVAQVGDDYDPTIIDAQQKIVDDEFAAQGLDKLLALAKLFTDHVRGYMVTKKIDSQRWLQEITR